MDLKKFIELHKKFSSNLLTQEDYNSSEYNNYVDALHDNPEFKTWIIEENLKKENFEYKSFCCIQMAEKIFNSLDKKGNIKYNDADVIMCQVKDGSFGIPIHDGGSSILLIKYCPWCGTKLVSSGATC